MLQAVADDSGTRDGPIFLLGALIAPVSNWVTFAEEWSAELDQPPRASYFKLQDAVRGVEEFLGSASKPELVAYKIKTLSTIIQAHVTHAFTVGLSLPEFNEILKPLLSQAEANPDLKGVSSPYFLPALLLLRGIDHQGLTEPVEVVFDEQAGEGVRVQQWWPELVKMYNDGTRRTPLAQLEPAYKRDQDFAPLQAANSLAWLAHRSYATKSLSNLTVEPPTLAEFLGKIPIMRKEIDAALLIKWRDEFLKRSTSPEKVS